MKVAPEIKTLIETYFQLIKDEDFESLYEKVESEWMIKELTEALLKADINPLEYMSRIPACFLAGNKYINTFNIPSNIRVIDVAAFRDCTQLASVNIPDSVVSIGGSAFSGCSTLDKVVIPDLVTTIERYTFYNCTSLTSLSLPNNLTTIKGWAFLHTSLVDLSYRGTKD